MKNNIGRNVDLSGINTTEIQTWLKNNKQGRKYIKCQAIISLSKGIAMQDVCKVLDITRESVRIWKMALRKNGLNGLLQEKKVGKRSKMGSSKIQLIKKLIKQNPAKYGYPQKKWTGVILSEYVKKKWKISIGTRTAQLWLKKLRDD